MEINTDYVIYEGNCYEWNDPQWIIIHYTAGADGVSARNNAIFYKREGAARQIGTNYFLGDDGIFLSTPENLGPWTNGNWEAGHHSITIEVACGTYEERFTDREVELLTELVTDIMGRYGIDENHVIRHYDVVDYFGGKTEDPHKLCPRQYINWEEWKKLRDTITGGNEMQFDEYAYKPLIDSIKIMDGTANSSTANCLIHTEQNGEKTLAEVRELRKEVANLKVSGAQVDYDKLATAVADKLAARLKD